MKKDKWSEQLISGGHLNSAFPTLSLVLSIVGLVVVINIQDCGKGKDDGAGAVPKDRKGEQKVKIVENVTPDAKGGGCGDPVTFFKESFPKPLGKGEKVSDWWPLKDGLEYNCKVIGSRWDFGEKYIGTEFKMKFVKVTDNQYSIEVTGFSEFPYKSLFIDGQRISTEQGMQVVFPLFE